MLIPQPFMGTIIGSGGSKINDLREVRARGVLGRGGDRAWGLFRCALWEVLPLVQE